MHPQDWDRDKSETAAVAFWPVVKRDATTGRLWEPVVSRHFDTYRKSLRSIAQPLEATEPVALALQTPTQRVSHLPSDEGYSDGDRKRASADR